MMNDELESGEDDENVVCNISTKDNSTSGIS